MAVRKVNFAEWVTTIDETYLEDYSYSFRNAEGNIVRIKKSTLSPKKIIPLTCSCCGGKINNNRCIYCDTEFYVER